MRLMFVGCSLTKRLKWANECGAYPAKLVLDGAESAQMFYDIPIMRFHIDPTSPSRTTGSSLFYFNPRCLLQAAIYLASLVGPPGPPMHRQVAQLSISLKNVFSHSETTSFICSEQEQGDSRTIFGGQEEIMSTMHAGRWVSVHYV